MFSFHHWFLLFFLGVFIVDCICSIDHCFFRCFYLTTVFECFHFNDFLLRDCFFVRYFAFELLDKSATDLRSFFYSQAFFTLHSFATFGTTCLYQSFPGASSSVLKVAGPPTEVRNTDPAHLFVWITQCSAKDISR